MTTLDEIVQNAYRELARKAFPIGPGPVVFIGYGEG